MCRYTEHWRNYLSTHPRGWIFGRAEPAEWMEGPGVLGTLHEIRNSGSLHHRPNRASQRLGKLRALLPPSARGGYSSATRGIIAQGRIGPLLRAQIVNGGSGAQSQCVSRDLQVPSSHSGRRPSAGVFRRLGLGGFDGCEAPRWFRRAPRAGSQRWRRGSGTCCLRAVDGMPRPSFLPRPCAPVPRAGLRPWPQARKPSPP